MAWSDGPHDSECCLTHLLPPHVCVCVCVLCISHHRPVENLIPSAPEPQMSGYRVIVEVAVLVVMVLSVGLTAALSAN
jgi:hypothetical protein